MLLTVRLLVWLRSLFAGRSNAAKATIAAVLFLLWPFVVVGLLATTIADLLGIVGPGQRLGAVPRLAVATVVLVVIGALGSVPGEGTRGPAPKPAPSAVAGRIAPAPTASVAAPVTPSPSSAVSTQAPPTAAPTPAPASTPAPTDAPTMTPEASASPTPTAVPNAIVVTDKVGDQLDDNDDPAKGPAYQDLTRVAAHVAPDEMTGDAWITFEDWVAKAPPAVDPVSNVISFNWYLDTNGDGTPEWQLTVQNTDSAVEQNDVGWVAGLTDLDGRTREGSSFPGRLLVNGAHVTVSFPLYEIEPTPVLAFAAGTESDIWADYANKPLVSVLRHDFVPNAQWPNGHDWLVVATAIE